MNAYPTPTLAPDPHQLTLDLRPPPRSPAKDYPARASPGLPKFQCCACGGVHYTRAEMLACKEGTR